LAANTGSATPTYEQWLEQRIEARRERYPDLPHPRQFSIVTAVWNTNPALLQACANSLLGQEGAENVEWILVDNGSNAPETVRLLEGFAKRANVRVIRFAQNLGIFRAMRIGLESAAGRYVLPLDHDDLLVRDCLRVFATAVRKHSEPAFLFSDEDLLIEGVPRLPYLRPDWDPVLNLASSYIWHAYAVRRDVALACDFYHDPGAEFCHDWDATMRLWQAGHSMVHVPEVLYHWRQHAESSTGKADPAVGSINSVRHILERFTARIPRPERYRVEDFPIFRGAREMYVLRNEFAADPIDLLVLGGDPTRIGALLDSLLATWHFPIREIGVWSPEPLDEAALQAFHGVLLGAAQRARISTTPRLFTDCPLSVATQALGAGLCAVLSQDLLAANTQTPWEALKHFEFFLDLGAIGGRILERDGRVADAGSIVLEDGRRHFVFAGLDQADPGVFALALKPQTLDCPSLDAFFVRREILLAATAPAHAPVSIAQLAIAAGVEARNAGQRIAMSPLIQLRLQDGAAAQRASASWTEPAPAPPSARRVSEMGFVALAGQFH